jgi:hypothetical protein
MNMRLLFLDFVLTNRSKKKKLDELFEVTAEAFQIEPPNLEGLRFKDLLRAYAEFTRDAAIREINKNKDVGETGQRLYRGAFRTGEKIRRELKIRSRKDAMRAARLIYSSIGIDFHYSNSGEVVVRRCYFSDFYSCQVCWIISSLDEGLIAGLTDGGRLWFVSRITEGSNCCIGGVDFKEAG